MTEWIGLKELKLFYRVNGMTSGIPKSPWLSTLRMGYVIKLMNTVEVFQIIYLRPVVNVKYVLRYLICSP